MFCRRVSSHFLNHFQYFSELSRSIEIIWECSNSKTSSLVQVGFIMKCPICHIESLNEVNLSTGLRAHQCTSCFGHWIPSERYWEWLDYREQVNDNHRAAPSWNEAEQEKAHPTRPVINLSTGNSLLPVVDNTTANFCADCSRLMTKTRVGRGLSFYIDRCSHCHGVWLDQNEWENLVEKDLHHQIHYMFSSAWQFSVRQERPSTQKKPA